MEFLSPVMVGCAYAAILSNRIYVERSHRQRSLSPLLSVDRFATNWYFTIMEQAFLQGTVHQASQDLHDAIVAAPEVLMLWQCLTPLGRNEFICWVEDAKQPKTRQRRIVRTTEELLEGKKRPCCWAGCIHRTDKAPSKWQQDVLIDKREKS